MQTLRSALVILGIILLPSAGQAQLVNENLLVGLPEGYKIDHSARNDRGVISEMVPKAETVKSWTEMVTVQIFFRSKLTSLDFRDGMKRNWSNACKGSEAKDLATGEENGYAYAFWLLSCPLNPATGKPEITYFKAIKGNDSFYVVQKAFKFQPDNAQIAHWSEFLKKVSVCDSRLPERACSKVKPGN